MSKQLSPLEALDRLYDYHNLPNRNVVAYLLEQENLPTYRKIIETALQRYESLQIVEPIVEKKLKALEIIKNKQVDCQLFINLFICQAYTYEDYFRYIIHTEYNKLTKEEYDLLKEIL